jgi:hypothetical protein
MGRRVPAQQALAFRQSLFGFSRNQLDINRSRATLAD